MTIPWGLDTAMKSHSHFGTSSNYWLHGIYCNLLLHNLYRFMLVWLIVVGKITYYSSLVDCYTNGHRVGIVVPWGLDFYKLGITSCVCGFVFLCCHVTLDHM